MQIKHILFTLFVCLVLQLLRPHLIIAGSCPDQCGGGKCDNTQPCGYQNVLVGACSTDTECNLYCYDEYTNCTAFGEDTGIYDGCDENRGYPCVTICNDGTTGCFEEFANVWCCNTPTPTEGGGGGGGSGDDPTNPPTTVPFNVKVQTLVEDNSYLSGGLCQQASNIAQSVDGMRLFVYNNSGYGQVINVSGTNWATFTLDTATTYNIMVSIPKTANLQFSCPTSLSETDTTSSAMYSDVYISPTTNTTINFFLHNNNLAEDWFQTFGGHVFANNRLRSPIPSATCGPSAVCSDALIAALTADPASSGHPFLFSSNAVNLQTSASVADYHHFISPGNKTPNLNSYITSFNTPSMSYQTLLDLASRKLQTVAATDNPSIWKSQSWWSDENFVLINGDLNLNETSGFTMATGDNLTVFVSGDLTLSDSNPLDTNSKITTSPRGSVLIFVVQGDITINNTVGWALNPATPTTPTVNLTNANLEGVFIANNRLILQSNSAVATALPDRKFIGAGTFVGWNGVELNRSFDDGGDGPILASTQAVENFIYRPDFLANWPETLKVSVSSWREIEPQAVEGLAPFLFTITPPTTPTLTPFPTQVAPTNIGIPVPSDNPEM